MHEVLVNRLGGLSLPRKSVVRLTDRPDMTLDVYRGRKTTNQQINNILSYKTAVCLGSATLKSENLHVSILFFPFSHDLKSRMLQNIVSKFKAPPAFTSI